MRFSFYFASYNPEIVTVLVCKRFEEDSQVILKTVFVIARRVHFPTKQSLKHLHMQSS